MTEEPHPVPFQIVPQVVTYPIAVQLDKIDVKLDRIAEKLDGKADRTELHRVDAKADALDERVTALETGQAADRAVNGSARRQSESRRASWALVVAVVAALAAVGAAIATLVH